MEEFEKKEVLQEVTIASWYQRLIGYLIDYVIAMLITAFIVFNICDYNYGYNTMGYWDSGQSYGFGMTGQKIVNSLTPLILLVYQIIFESIFNVTLGKIITCTVVRKQTDFEKVGFWRILLRSVCRIIPFEALSYLSNQPIGWHDSLSDTVVINASYNLKTVGRIVVAWFLCPFKAINTGLIRLSWALSILLGIYFVNQFSDEWRRMMSGYSVDWWFFIELLVLLMAGFVVYWIALRLILWIWDGFKNSEIK
jgi:hypothetical protein